MSRTLLNLILISLSISTIQAQENPTPSPKTESSEISFMVHGVVLDKELFEYRLQAAIQAGQADSTALRLFIRDELYNRALLLEEAKRLGITKNKIARLMAQETQENFYIDLAIQEYLKQHPIAPEQIKAEYEQQIKQLGPKGTVVEYRLSIIVLNDEKQSLELLKRAKKENFATLATDNSMDPSASQGGDIGWISKTQLEEPLKQVVLETPVGAIAKNPIKVGSRWHLVKVVNHREGRPASFEASQDRMKSSLLVKLRNNYVQELRETQTKINR